MKKLLSLVELTRLRRSFGVNSVNVTYDVDKKIELKDIPLADLLLRDISDFELPEYIKVHLKKEITYVWQFFLLSDSALKNISGIGNTSVLKIRKSMYRFVDHRYMLGFRFDLFMRILRIECPESGHKELSTVSDLGKNRVLEVEKFIRNYFKEEKK